MADKRDLVKDKQKDYGKHKSGMSRSARRRAASANADVMPENIVTEAEELLPVGDGAAEVPEFMTFEEEDEEDRAEKAYRAARRWKRIRRSSDGRFIGPNGMYPLLNMGKKATPEQRRSMRRHRILTSVAVVLVAGCTVSFSMLYQRDTHHDMIISTTPDPTAEIILLNTEDTDVAPEVSPDARSVQPEVSPEVSPEAEAVVAQETVMPIVTERGDAALELLGLGHSAISSNALIDDYDGLPIFPSGQNHHMLKLGMSGLQNAVEDEQRAANRPTVTVNGFLPVFTHAKTTEKIVAITIEDCYHTDNLDEICQMTYDLGGKLTLFPIGQVVKRSQLSLSLMQWHELGFELENHTYSHASLSNVNSTKLASEIWTQNQAISEMLGMAYQVHFLRPVSQSENMDQRIHTYADQMGYYGIASCSVVGSGCVFEDLCETVKPGEIYSFSTTTADKLVLREFIPWLVEQGYTLVTLNEMFGYPANETGSGTVSGIVPLRDYETVPVECKTGNRSFLVLRIQNRLMDLGYLAKGADGEYGENTVQAVKAFQKQVGLPVNGIANADVQEKLFATDAPEAV